MFQIHLTSQPLDVAACIRFVQDEDAGGIAVFIGTVRRTTQHKRVERLHFEAYEPMARQQMKLIAHEAMQKWPVHRIAIHHRTGTLQLGEIPVVIAASAPHRDAAFEACRYAIDTLKQHVPIWKKEFFDDGEVWVAAHP